MASSKKPADKAALTPAQIAENKANREKEKAENFKRLAVKRVSKALTSIKYVEQLSNKNSYTYDTTQVTLILNALKKAVNEVESAFASSKDSKASFSL